MAPAELEGLLINHPGIDDVGIFGVPDKEAGELPKALVVRKPGVTVTKEEIHAFVDGKLELLRFTVKQLISFEPRKLSTSFCQFLNLKDLN